jgi:hypothetical protein
MERIKRNAAPLLLAAALLTAAVVTLVFTAKTTFAGDTWDFLINRRHPSVDVLLTPHSEHIVVIPALIEELLLRVFGMDSARPEQLVLMIFLLVAAALFYVYMKRRLGPWLALLATVLILFLGPAWEVLLWPFEITFVGPVVFGLAMLLALEREDTYGDLTACACLALALGFSNLGIAFIPAAVVAVLVGPQKSWLRRSYVFLIPAALFGIWYIGWGSEAESHLSLHNVLASPQFVFDSAATAVGSLSGLGTDTSSNLVDLTWGRPLLVALVAAVGYWKVRRGGHLNRWLWPVATAALINWLLIGFNLSPGRAATASRYQYVGGIFVLMILANLLEGVRVSRRAIVACAIVVAVAVGPNVVVLRNGSSSLEQQAVLTRSDTAALELARRSVAPDFQLTPEIAGTPMLVNIYAREYLEAVDEYGSPAYSPAELENAPAEGRHAADVVLGQALPLSVTQVGKSRGLGGDCVEVAGEGQGPAEVPLAPGTTLIEVAPGPHTAFSLRRFSDPGEFPVQAEGTNGGSVVALRIPRDHSRRPWQLHVEANQSARVCR